MPALPALMPALPALMPALPALSPPAGPVSVSAPGRSAAAGESDADRAVSVLYGAQYRTLVRLAALLAGDLRTAEEVVQDSFAAMHRAWRRLRSHDAALSFLHRSVVTRCRTIAPEPGLAVPPRYAPPGDGEVATAAQPGSRAAEPGAGAAERRAALGAAPLGAGSRTGVIAALQALPAVQREALALRLYLDLPDDQVAAAMRVSQPTARAHIAAGLAALRGVA
jgi:DNA-directed RNA polymerase specialized sigma24 family protein